MTFTYDKEWQLTSITLGAGSAEAATTTFSYDAVGNLTKATDPRGQAWTNSYDNRDRRISATDPLAHTTAWTYDAASNRLTETRPDGGATTNIYDAMNRLTQSTDPKSQVTAFAYNDSDNLISLTDARGNTYGFAYDLLQRKTRMTYPDASHEDWAYDAVGNMTAYTTRAGQVMACTYDTRNRDTLCDWSDSTPDVSKTYDAASRLLTLNNSVSHLTYTYDAASQLLSETQDILALGAPKTVGYGYDADGNRLTLTDPSGSVVTYGYTARNQTESITLDGPPPLATYAYDLNGNRTIKTLENGASASYAYDNANRLTQLAHSNGAGVLAQFGYTLDSVGNRTSKAVAGMSMPAAQTEAYQYDAIDQLTNVAYGAGRTTAFNYDATGNRTSVADSAGIVPASYAANNLNQYTAVDASAPAYDANGNLINYAGQTFGYDSDGKLLSITGGTASLSSTYDARRRAVSRTVNGVTTYFVWDGWSLIEERDTLGDVTAKYIHGAMIDELLAKTDTVSTVYYHHDGLGSTVALTDGAGVAVESYTYDVFGDPSFFGPTGLSIPVSASQNRFLFTGREWIGEIETYDYRNRAYSPKLGRFLQTDPIGFEAADVNLYRYVANSPINWTDPLGLDVFFNQENELGGHAWTKIGGNTPTGGNRTYGAYPNGDVFGKPEVILNPDPHTNDDDFSYERYKTTPEDEAALEKWTKDNYDINDFNSKRNPDYNLGSEDCRSFRNRMRNQLEKIIKDRGGKTEKSTGSVPKTAPK